MAKHVEMLLATLACPCCHGALTRDTDAWKCSACGAVYGIQQGVPRLLTPARVTELDARIANFKQPHQTLRQNAFARALIPPSPVYDPFETSRHARIRELAPKGLVLNLGSKASDWGEHVLNVDLVLPAGHSETHPSVDVLADIQHLPFADATADAVICTSVLEHVGNAHDCISEIKRVLKPGGLVYVTVPFIFPTHPDPLDRRRWTREGLQAEFSGFEELESGACGGPFSAYVSITPTLLGSVFSSFFLYNAVRFVFGWLMWPFKFLDFLAARSRNADRTASNVYFLGRKR
jgi:SAM-dependent methyltransferase